MTPSPAYFGKVVKCRLKSTGPAGVMLNEDVANWAVCLSKQWDVMMADRGKALAEIEKMQNIRVDAANKEN